MAGQSNSQAFNLTNNVDKMIYLDPVLGGRTGADGATPWRAFGSHFSANSVNTSGAQWYWYPGTYPTNTIQGTVTNNIWQSAGGLIPFNKTGHILDVWGDFEQIGGAVFDANLANASLHYPFYIEDVTSKFTLRSSAIYGMSDCIFKQNPGSDSTNFTILNMTSCTLTSKWDTMVFLNFSLFKWGSNFVTVSASDFRAEGDTNFYSSLDGTGGNCVHIFGAQGNYNFYGDRFYNRNDGSVGTYGISATGTNTVVNVANCVFDIQSTNGPAYWLFAATNAVINYYGPRLPTNYWATVGGGVINFLGTNVLGTDLQAGTLPITAADTSWPPRTNYPHAVGPLVAGNIMVFNGTFDSFGSPNYTNGPNAGGGTGAGFPLGVNGDGQGFTIFSANIERAAEISTTNTGSKAAALFTAGYNSGYGAAIQTLTGITNSATSLSGYAADFFLGTRAMVITNGGLSSTVTSNSITTGQGTFNGGTSNYLGGVTISQSGIGSTLSNLSAPTSFTFPATTVNWTNPITTSIEVYIDNGAVTGTAIKKNGTTISSSVTGDANLGLQPGEYFSETYTVGTPTGKWSPFP